MRGWQLWLWRQSTSIVMILLVCTLEATGLQAADYPGALPDNRVAKGERGINAAWLSDATTRYRHFVLGSNYEAASLSARLDNGKILKLTLDDDYVFEDRQPRLADIDGDGRDEIVVVRSSLTRGAAVAVIGIVDGQLKIKAETPPTGSANTWVNPAGIADFDGDGALDIAFVQMPHVLGRLRVVTLRRGKLVLTATLEGLSNHVAGSPHLGLAAVADFNGDGVADLAIPSLDRRRMRFVTLKGGVREIGSQPLPSPVVGNSAIQWSNGRAVVLVNLGGGKTASVYP